MNLLFSCIGQRGYVADFFRAHLTSEDRIIGTGNSRWTPGFGSCDASFLLPDIVDDDYIPAVLALCEREKIDAVLSFLDPDVHRLAQATEDFQRIGVLPLLPSAELATVTFDKFRMYEFLIEKGIPTPKTTLTEEEALRELSFPMIVKPRRGSGSYHTFVARNERELTVFFNYQPDMIVQEMLRGEEFDIELCGDLEGQPIGMCTWKKHRSRLGETEQAETMRDPLAMEFGLRVGDALRIRGPMDLDTFRDGDTFAVLEANTRFGGGYPVSHLAGADFPKLLIQLVRHGTAEPNFDFEAGVVMMKRLDVIGGPADKFFRNELKLK